MIFKEYMKRLLPDSLYLKRYYYLKFGRPLDLNNPKTFNEKLQWLKLYDRNPLYSRLVDKYDVKSIVADAIDNSIIIPTLGVWNSFNEIDFDSLPDKFVIKCTHDSGGVFICKDKNSFDYYSVKKELSKALKTNYYFNAREWPYKKVKPRIIAEAYVENGDNGLVDYKFHCFNGEPKVILVCKDRFSQSGLTEDFFDCDWNHLNIKRPQHSFSEKSINPPDNLEYMLNISRQLSKDIPFVRVDLYEVKDRVYFSELTFYPGAGFLPFEDDDSDLFLGSLLELPCLKE